jgi:hypothetical protein
MQQFPLSLRFSCKEHFMEKRTLARASLISCICFLTAWTGAPVVGNQKSKSADAPAKSTLPALPDFGKTSIYFIPNLGQMDERVDYYVQGKDKTIYFSPEGVTFALIKADKARWAVKLNFVGANPGVKPIGADETGTVISYFQGGPGNWRTGIAAVSRITYSNLWPGVDLVFTGSQDKLKYEFIVRPGAEPSRIRLAYRGANSVTINPLGDLVISTPSGTFEDGMPAAYQEHSGNRVSVPLAYKIEGSSQERTEEDFLGKNGGNEVIYGFSFGEYDKTKPLILDPVILIYCGYLGGSDFDYGYGIAAGKTGAVYLTGYTYSLGADFPVTAGPDLTFNGGGVDAFVAKVNSSGTALDYCGYIGGAGDDYGYGIAVDPSGSAYIAGYTTSPGSSFPVVVGPDLTLNGLTDAFIAKVNPEGTVLEYCGYIGGAGQTYGRAVAVDHAGNAYITGYTNSVEATFPVAGGLDLTQNGDSDAFVAQVNPQGSALLYCGYIGGSGDDVGAGIAVDGSGNAYVTGYTNSTESTFPVVAGPDLTQNGNYDAFLAKVAAQGAGLVYCGFIGGSYQDYARSVAVDSLGQACITGNTASDEDTFPTFSGPDLSFNGGYYDAFVTKVDESGTAPVYSGFIGGSGYDVGTGIAIDDWGYVYVTGYTSSEEDSFPVKEGPVLTQSGSFDAFVAKVPPQGAALVYCGYIGGTGADLGMSLALDARGTGNVYLTGNTYSTESSFPLVSGPDLSFNGSRDAFVAKINEVSIVVTSPNGGEGWHADFMKDITWLTMGSVGNVRIEYSIDEGESWIEIAASTENDGGYTWKVPAEASAKCLVRISEADDGEPSDVSDAAFEIWSDPVIVVTSPNGGESWQIGSAKNITWVTAGGVGDVKIDYSTDYGITWTEIIASTENDGSYTWIVPDAASTECMVRISEAEDGDPSDKSDEVFTITAGSTFQISSPLKKKK